VKRALLGLLLVVGAAAAHVGLIFAGVYRRHPFEWWAVALIGVIVAASAFRKPGVAPRVVAVVTIVLAGIFGYVTTVGTRIARPELAIAAGQKLPAFTLVADDGKALEFPNAASTRRATLLVLFRGVW
jgi:hypothetical protein